MKAIMFRNLKIEKIGINAILVRWDSFPSNANLKTTNDYF